MYVLILILFDGKCCMMFVCQFDNNLFALLLFEGIVKVIVKTKVYMATTSYARSWSSE
jgi:hypothetical protein